MGEGGLGCDQTVLLIFFGFNLNEQLPAGTFATASPPASPSVVSETTTGPLFLRLCLIDGQRPPLKLRLVKGLDRFFRLAT